MHPFPHERLEAYRQARRARVLAWNFTNSLPSGFGDEARQINKAAASVVRNTCEGANRYKPAEKIQRFEIAQGEAGEAAGAVESLLDLGVGNAEEGRAFIANSRRTSALLTGLIRATRRRQH